MISPNEVVSLNPAEKELHDRMVDAIDTNIQAINAEKPETKTFSLKRAALAKAVTEGKEGVVLTQKVIHHVSEGYRKIGWAVSMTADELILQAPERRKGGRRKGQKNAKTATAAAA